MGWFQTACKVVGGAIKGINTAYKTQKWLKWATIGTAGVVAGTVIATSVAENKEKPLTEEQKVAACIELFAESYNGGDWEGLMSSVDRKTRMQIEMMYGMMNGLLGGLTGVQLEISLSDLFSWGVELVDGEIMQVIIEDIEITGSETAEAECQLWLRGVNYDEAYFFLLKEEGDWVIYDIKDEYDLYPNSSWTDSSVDEFSSVSESDSETAEDSTANSYEDFSSEITSNEWENSEDGNEENSSEDDSENGAGNGGNMENQATMYELMDGDLLIDGVAWGMARREYQYFHVFFNEQGEILYKEVYQDDTAVYNIGKGSGMICSSNGCKLIQSNGTIVDLQQEIDCVNVYGGGYAYVYDYRSSMMSIEYRYGVLDYQGNWIYPMKNLGREGALDGVEYAGGEYFTKYYEKDEDGQWIYGWLVMSGTEYIDVRGVGYDDVWFVDGNGCVYVNNDDNGAQVSYYQKDKCVFTKQMKSNFSILNEGVLKETAFVIMHSGEKVVTWGDYLTVVDLYTDEQIAVTKYPAEMVSYVKANEDYIMLEIEGVDGNLYYTVWDKNGKELYSPFINNASYEMSLCSNGNLFYCDGDNWCMIDVNGNVTKMADYYYGVAFRGDIGRVWLRNENRYIYIDANGKQLFSKLTDKANA